MEDHTFYFEFAFHSVTRHFLLHVGKRLAEAGAIEQADDIFFLVPDEVLKLIYDPYKFSAQARVAMRKAQWEEAKKLVPELFMTSIPIEEGLKEVAESQDIICGKTGTSGISEPKPELKADLIGETGSSGSAEGPARVILSVDQMWEIQPGEILVTAGTDSTWTPVFSLIKGLVADSGGSLSHAAIIGREYGIPVVINTNKAVRTIKTGQWIKIDADLGAVWIRK